MTSEARFRIRLKGNVCVYCGEPAGTYDHWPPRSYTDRGWLLPACKECNSLAGTDYPTDFLQRANLVNKKLRQRYKKEIYTPDWSEEELLQLGPSLRSTVIPWAIKCEISKKRIAWNAINQLSRIDHTESFALIYAESDITELLKKEETETETQSSRDLEKELENLKRDYSYWERRYNETRSNETLINFMRALERLKGFMWDEYGETL